VPLFYGGLENPSRTPSCVEGHHALNARSKETRMNPFIWLLFQLIDLYWYVILATVIMSWLMAFNIINYSNPYVRQVNSVLRTLTEPVLAPIRRILPSLGGLDFSPIVLLFALEFLRQAVIYYIVH
jgi:YggT family protein